MRGGRGKYMHMETEGGNGVGVVIVLVVCSVPSLALSTNNGEQTFALVLLRLYSCGRNARI